MEEKERRGKLGRWRNQSLDGESRRTKNLQRRNQSLDEDTQGAEMRIQILDGRSKRNQSVGELEPTGGEDQVQRNQDPDQETRRTIVDAELEGLAEAEESRKTEEGRFLRMRAGK